MKRVERQGAPVTGCGEKTGREGLLLPPLHTDQGVWAPHDGHGGALAAFEPESDVSSPL